MLRVLIALGILFLASSGAVWLAEHPGTVRYEWQGTAGELSTTEAAAVLAAAVIGLLLAAEVLRAVWRLPRRLRDRRRERRRQRGWQALSTGVLALGAGHEAAARKAAADAGEALPHTGAATFLAAQAAQLAGDSAAAVRHFTTLANDSETRTLGLRGLALEAARAGDQAAALRHAEAALAADASLAWAATAAFDAAASTGDFAAALARLPAAAKARRLDKAAQNRLRAVLLTAQALDHPDPVAFREGALQAHTLAKDFVPAALAASRAAAVKSRRQAAGILEETFRRSPHPDLFRAALDLEEGGAEARLTRAKALAALAPMHVESAIGLARAALSAREPQTARSALLPHLEPDPPQRVCILMAEIEALAPGDEGRVRDWLARAVRAPIAPQWIADGVIAAAWAPVSPRTGRLDAFVWRTPDTIGEPPRPAIELPPALPAPGAPPRPSVPSSS